MAEELKPVLAARFSTLPENEITAAFLAVEDTLGKVDLSDEALPADDADAEQLASASANSFPPARPCSPSATLAAILGRLSRQSDQLDQLLASHVEGHLDLRRRGDAVDVRPLADLDISLYARP
ncbi:hypothetical protein DL990_13775 [Amycolatopsis sp. WAC 01416]|uniref:NACHT N-terminal Helical domain 1-containing protein n=1 Tax=Amycolatopsis sp. WAC 01416 TaxID=2203196 RepID=UPI000F769B07|nr:hypothetical protein [Amycolatopsis sp. WAC 01416]RSN33087.1 hypothetical protein DL990_13775 [Amycolatopsis sp. WAC 01416]